MAMTASCSDPVRLVAGKVHLLGGVFGKIEQLPLIFRCVQLPIAASHGPFAIPPFAPEERVVMCLDLTG